MLPLPGMVDGWLRWLVISWGLHDIIIIIMSQKITIQWTTHHQVMWRSLALLYTNNNNVVMQIPMSVISCWYFYSTFFELPHSTPSAALNNTLAISRSDFGCHSVLYYYIVSRQPAASLIIMQYPFRQFTRWWMDDLWSFINHFVATKCDLHMTLFELYYWQFIADGYTRPGASV